MAAWHVRCKYSEAERRLSRVCGGGTLEARLGVFGGTFEGGVVESVLIAHWDSLEACEVGWCACHALPQSRTSGPRRFRAPPCSMLPRWPQWFYPRNMWVSTWMDALWWVYHVEKHCIGKEGNSPEYMCAGEAVAAEEDGERTTYLGHH